MTDRETRSRALKILAKSILRDLEAQGCDPRHVVELATALLDEIATRLARATATPRARRVA